jgi:ubiquitin-protein ligase
MSDFKPLSPDRLQLVNRVLGSLGEDADDGRQSLVVDRETGNVVGEDEPDKLNPDRVNAIARFDRHYAGLRDDSRRLVQEVRAVKERWGGRAVLRDDGRRTWWEVELLAEGNRLPVRVEYPDNYPASPPRVVPLKALPPNTPHRIEGNLCWYYQGSRRSRNRWDPGRDSAAVVIGAAHRWFLAFLVWTTTGTWPVGDAIGT